MNVRIRGFRLLSIDGKIYAEILVDRVHRVTWGLIDYEQGGLRAGRGCVDQFFMLRQMGEKALEKRMWSVCGFYRFGECV